MEGRLVTTSCSCSYHWVSSELGLDIPSSHQLLLPEQALHHPLPVRIEDLNYHHTHNVFAMVGMMTLEGMLFQVWLNSAVQMNAMKQPHRK